MSLPLPSGEGSGEGTWRRQGLGTREWGLGYGLRTTDNGQRAAFTLVELLVAISIIGILSALALGGMYRANVAARETNSRTTVKKVAAQINEIWESYRTRKLPIDPGRLLLSKGSAPYTYQYTNAVSWLNYYSQIRVANGGAAFYPDPKAPPTYAGVNPSNNLQIAAIRLAATRELMRLEMPCRFADFTSSTSGAPSSALPVQALLIPQPMNGAAPLANPGGLSEQYRQFFIANANTFNHEFESAECLYMIIKFASQNELGQRSITDDPRLVGDVDGDGMPEIQDAFTASSFTAPPLGSAYTQHNMPIKFIRWPAGYLSDLQPGPTANQYAGSNPTAEYAAGRHDIYDPLRIDPRAFTLTPLVYSAGANGSAGGVGNPTFDVYDLWENSDFSTLPPAMQWAALCDPYFTDNTPTKPNPIFPIVPNAQNLNPSPAILYPLPGAVMDRGTVWPSGYVGNGAYADNITNHLLNSRSE